MDELPSQSRRNLDHPGQRDDLGSVPDGYTAGSDPLRSTWDSDVPALTDDRPANAGVLRAMLAELSAEFPWSEAQAERWWQTHMPASEGKVETREPAPASELIPAGLS